MSARAFYVRCFRRFMPRRYVERYELIVAIICCCCYGVAPRYWRYVTAAIRHKLTATVAVIPARHALFRYLAMIIDDISILPATMLDCRFFAFIFRYFSPHD